ncbi:MAG TPA: SgcJ/EcaC family oxidoreductase, partial [Pirellulaceae bacterium]
NADAYVAAYNRRDAQALAQLWAPEAVYTDPASGAEFVGRPALAEHFAEILPEASESKLSIQIGTVEFLSPNVAVEHGDALVEFPDEDAEKSTYSALHVKRDGKWLLDRITESESVVEPESNYPHLKELEWTIGTWMDSDEEVSIQTDCNWARNRNFLTRSFAVLAGDEVDMAGMQVIGWDPAAKQIRSWVFDSDGGFGEGKWSRKGNIWYIHTTAMMPDGTRNSAVNILKYVDDDTCTWQSIDREADGEMLPNIDEVVLKRVP